MVRYFCVLLLCLMTLGLTQEFPYLPETRLPIGLSRYRLDLIEAKIAPQTRSLRVVETHQPVWRSLERMSLKDRQNAEITIDLGMSAISQAIHIARQIENLWNSERFEQALALFPELEKITDMDEIEIGISWRIPIPTKTQLDWAEDVRIGNRDSIYFVALDIHRATGNLFALLVNYDSLDYWWSVNFSTDEGATWSETYAIRSGINYSYNTISASVLANHCYVAYDFQTIARLRRFKVSDGAQENFNNGAPFINVFTTTSPDSVKEVVVTGNQDFFNNRLYYLAITTQGNLKFFYDDTGAVSWTEIPTNVDYADRALDATCNQGFADWFLWACYISNGDSIHIDAIDDTPAWTKFLMYPSGNYTRYTTIGAYHDTIICAFDYDGPVTMHSRYLTSYNGGSTWGYGNVGDDTTTISEAADVSARAGGGQGIVYRYYTPVRQLRYTWRDYWGRWSEPFNLVEHEPYYNKPAIEYLGNNAYGVVYVNWARSTSDTWYFGPQTDFRFTRFDGTFFPQTKRVYFLGGRLSNGSTDGSVWCFVPDSGEYHSLGVTMTIPVSNYNICLLQDNYSAADTYGLYIVGGRMGSGAKTPAVQVYYPRSNTVRVIGTDSLPMRINGRIPIPGANVVVNNKMYVFGGFNESIPPYVTNETWVYDPLAAPGNRWTQITTANLSLARTYITTAVVDNKIYAIGGDIYTGSLLRAQRICEVFDPANPGAGWQTIAQLPDSSGETRAFGFEPDSPYRFANKIIVAGNGKWSSETNQCFIYDIASNTWSTFRRLGQARRNHAGVFIPGTEWTGGIPGIWVFGGRALNDTNVLRSCEYYPISPGPIIQGAYFDRSDWMVGLGENIAVTAKIAPFISLAPNPSRGLAKLFYSVRREGKVKISLYDATGRRVKRLLDEPKAPGEYVFNINQQSLTSGIYFIQVKTSDGVYRKAMTIVR